MKCPYCGYQESKVVDSRHSDDGLSIRRRRECLQCQKRFTTYETVESLPIVVIKRDSSRQQFDRNKILNGMLRACEKRPVPLAELERAADEIEQAIQNSLDREISTEKIGELVMERLKPLDEVAYVRFASVYRQFKDIAFGYTGLDESERSFDYYASGGFTARMMVGMLQTLWDDPETFGQEIEYLKEANPGEYLESGDCGLEIAQKYGYEHYDGVLNICIAGIVYTDEPFLITVLTRGVGWAEVLMGELCDAFAEYEQTREHVEPELSLIHI